MRDQIFDPEDIHFPAPWEYIERNEHGEPRIVNTETGRAIRLNYAIKSYLPGELFVSEYFQVYEDNGKEIPHIKVGDIPVKKLLRAFQAATMLQSKLRKITRWYPQHEVEEFYRGPSTPLPTARRPYPKYFLGLVALQYNAFAVADPEKDPEKLMMETNRHNMSPTALHRWVNKANSYGLLVPWPTFIPKRPLTPEEIEFRKWEK